MAKKIDRRISKTKKSIRNALIELLEKKKLSEITITELSDVADINRKTFYTHYSSVENILESFGEELINQLMVIINHHDFLKSNLDVSALFKNLNDVIEIDFEFFDVLIRTDAYYVMINQVKDYLRDSLVESYSKLFGINQDLFSLYTEFIASGIINMYVEWFKSDRTVSLETLGESAGQITFEGLSSIIQKK